MTSEQKHLGFRLGRRAPKRAPALRLATFLTGRVPPHPKNAEHFSRVTDWGLYGNDEFGDCGPVSVANEVKLVTKYLGGAEVSVLEADVFDLYRRSGNPDFNPDDPGGPGDGGVDMQTMLEALAAGGIAGRKCLAFAAVDHTVIDHMRAAIAIFGSVLLGVNLEVAQREQTNVGLWDYRRSGEWGGHAVLAGRYTGARRGADLGVVSWGLTLGVTDAFSKHQVEEAWVVIWPEHLGTAEFQAGVDLTALAADYKALTGRVLPTGK